MLVPSEMKGLFLFAESILKKEVWVSYEGKIRIIAEESSYRN